MSLLSKTSRLGTPATQNPLNSSYQTSLFEEKAGSLSTFTSFEASNNGVVPGSSLGSTPPTTTTTSTTTTTTTL
jgi:hypothetical protein